MMTATKEEEKDVNQKMTNCDNINSRIVNLICYFVPFAFCHPTSLYFVVNECLLNETDALALKIE